MPRETKPEILLITRNLPPLIGGMERLMLHTCQGLAEDFELTVVGPTGCSGHLPPDVKVYEVSHRLPLFMMIATLKAVCLCLRKRPSLVLGGSGLVAPILVLLSGLFRCRTAVFVHGLDIIVDNPVYQRLFAPCLKHIHLVIANSRNTQKLALERGVSQANTVVINPGTDLPKPPDAQALEEFRQRHDIHFGEVLIFVGRMTRRKGLSGFIRHCLPTLLESRPDAGLVVVGDNPTDSLNRLGEEEEVLAASHEGQWHSRIKFLGKVDDDALTHAYALADVQILPLIDVPGDVEGFGMIAVEAAACGTPTVAFNLGGVPDAIFPANGRLVKPGDYEAFGAEISSILDAGDPNAQSCVEHAHGYSWPRYHRQVNEALAFIAARQTS